MTSNISLKNSDKLALMSNFSTMLTAGISILDTVDSLLEDSKDNQKKILTTVREDIVQGKRLYSSFAKFPQIFDKVTINIIKAAEEAGTLDTTLLDLKNNIKADIEFTDKIKAALTYPILILIVFGGVLLLLLTFVIPKISAVFLRLRVDLPLPTQILIFASNLLITNTVAVVGGLILFCLLIVVAYKSNKTLFIQILLSMPVLRELSKTIDLTRFSRSLHLLLSAGIPIVMALDFAKDVVVKKEVVAALLQTRELVLSGRKFSEGLKNARHIFTSIMIKIIEAGEKSGSLEKSMQDVTEYLDYQVSNTLRTAISLIEPIMLIVVGLLVGGMMLAIIAPIYGLIGQVGGR